MKRALTVLAGATLTALAAAGCSTVNTAPDQIALHYSGGSFSSQTFKECISPGTRNVNGPGEHYFYYPTGQRTFKFSDDAGSDSKPLTASTKDQQELVVKGTITFTLNTSCDKFTDSTGREWPGGKLQKFNDTIGRKYSAYATEGNVEPGDGWDQMLGVYIKDIADRAIDNEALKYGWESLYNDVSSKAKWEQDVIGAIPALVKAQAGEDFFTINNVVLQKPDISSALKEQLAAKQAAVLRGQAAQVDQKTAESWPGGIAAYLAYQQQLAINKAITDGKVQILPVPQGVGINITPK
jgi:hypothetical protein